MGGPRRRERAAGPRVPATGVHGAAGAQAQLCALPADCDWSALEELFRHAILALLVARERLAETTREMLLSWRHSGFGVDASSGAAAGDREGLHRLACYLHKPVLLLGSLGLTRSSRHSIDRRGAGE